MKLRFPSVYPFSVGLFLVCCLLDSSITMACSFPPYESTVEDKATELLSSESFVGRVRLLEKERETYTYKGGKGRINKFKFAVLEQFRGEPVQEITAYCPHDSCGYNQKIDGEDLVKIYKTDKPNAKPNVFRPRTGDFTTDALIKKLRELKKENVEKSKDK